MTDWDLWTRIISAKRKKRKEQAKKDLLEGFGDLEVLVDKDTYMTIPELVSRYRYLHYTYEVKETEKG